MSLRASRFAAISYCAFRSRRVDEAIAAYRTAVELQPDDADFHNKLGLALQETDAAVNRATKLLRTFTAQVETLNRYRGKTTEQHVTVEHVNVHQGGQAIVGAVTGGPGVGDNEKK